MKHNIVFILFFIIVMLVALKPSQSIKSEKILYCKIDSTAIVQKEPFSPELINKYWTACNTSFLSKDKYNVGDSIPIKIIQIQ